MVVPDGDGHFGRFADDGDGVGRRDGYAAEHASAEPFGAVDQTVDVARRGRERMQCQRALCGLDLADPGRGCLMVGEDRRGEAVDVVAAFGQRFQRGRDRSGVPLA